MEEGDKEIFNKNKPIANQLVVLREEFDDWAILFDPDSGNGFGINPISVFIYKLLDGHHTIEDILKELRENFDDVSDKAESHIRDFINSLVKQGLAGYEIQKK